MSVTDQQALLQLLLNRKYHEKRLSTVEFRRLKKQAKRLGVEDVDTLLSKGVSELSIDTVGFQEVFADYNPRFRDAFATSSRTVRFPENQGLDVGQMILALRAQVR